MAKQRGLHQIIGKYNDTCYFERKGTRGGLLRRINSGMSERVKFGNEFANLRSANSVFGACSLYASIIFNFFNKRTLFLFNKNRQSQLTRLLYRVGIPQFIKEDLLSAGFSSEQSSLLALLFDSVVRKKFYEVFSGFPRQIRATDIDVDYRVTLNSEDLEEYCKKYNADGVLVSTIGPCYIYPLLRETANDKFKIQEYGSTVPRYGHRWRRGDGDLSFDINVGSIDDAASFGFIDAIPERYVQSGLPVQLNNGACCGMFSIYIGL